MYKLYVLLKFKIPLLRPRSVHFCQLFEIYLVTTSRSHPLYFLKRQALPWIRLAMKETNLWIFTSGPGVFHHPRVEMDQWQHSIPVQADHGQWQVSACTGSAAIITIRKALIILSVLTNSFYWFYPPNWDFSRIFCLHFEDVSRGAMDEVWGAHSTLF